MPFPDFFQWQTLCRGVLLNLASTSLFPFSLINICIMIHLFASETGYLGFGFGYGKCMFIMFVLTVDTVGAL
ncbi:hypothetical protein BDV33DRAFT_48496 [Aspergillus novoparasiticus]|uniref:Uncharacterized protein n=1 Tax=Aspergillus novoparasiticus TaxID=986946 RepID=A0A5N6E8D6_9EURO|nr:hypothetical protein BDV33DRAFT_48496 [Aspergillus novoparasiticus]